MRSKVLPVSVGLSLVVLMLMSTTYADVSHDPAAPVAIPYDQGLDFSVVGSRAGAFAYYSIDYPGDGRVVTIELDLAPGDPVAMLGAGFNVYGPNGYWIGVGLKSSTKVDRKVLQWSDYNPAPWLIQVYNYLEEVPVSFHLQVSGLPAPQVPREPVMLPEQAQTFAMTTGGLLGDQGGNYHYYKIDSSGDGSQVTLELYHTPDNQLISQGFGMNVYAPQDGILVASGSHEVSFNLQLAGTYLVQVYNYVHGVNIQYVLTKK